MRGATNVAVPAALGGTDKEHDAVGINAGWKRTRLRELTTKIGSGATPLGGEEAYKATGIALIRSLNV